MSLFNRFKQLVKCIPGSYSLYGFVQRFQTIKGAPAYSLNRGSRPRVDFEALRREYEQSPVSREPDRFVLYRIIGNDLVPRHRKGQSRENLRFILENEAEFAGCEKRFVVNRIVDPNEEEAIIAMLEEAGVGYLRIPFSWREYQSVPWDIFGVPPEYAPFTQRFAFLPQDEQERVLMRLCRHKNNYVMHNNGARNAALQEGRKRAKWVLPFDGNCFIPANAWEEIAQSVRSRPYIPYFIVPMTRVTDNSLLLDPRFSPEPTEEPQVLFRSDSELCFNQEFYYGRRPKVELLWRLGVPGKWDRWPFEPWDLPGPNYCRQAGCFAWAGWVARLSSGQAGLENASEQSMINRGLARNQAVFSLLDELDSALLSSRNLTPPKVINKSVASAGLTRLGKDSLSNTLYSTAEEALARGPYSVTHKTTLPPSGDIHDYWHPAPYYWPNPLMPSGRPYVSRDGKRVPGTRLYEPESEKYDRTRLQRLFDDTLILALAWLEFQEQRFAEHGACLVRTWFLDPETAMNPSLNYAQVCPGHNKDQGSSFGIIEMKDLYYFLDAVRILEGSGHLSHKEQKDLGQWLQQYLHWLQTSPQGRKERASPNNHGVYYDLQLASIAAFLEEHLTLRDTLRDSRHRILQHFDSQGRQPEEMKRTMTAHYCCFNLQGWIHLAQLAESCGEDLWSFQGEDGRGIQAGMHWLLPHMGREWPYEQIEAFDEERLYPIYYACQLKYELPQEIRSMDVPAPGAIKPLFHPHDGIRPFWQRAIDHDLGQGSRK